MAPLPLANESCLTDEPYIAYYDPLLTSLIS